MSKCPGRQKKCGRSMAGAVPEEEKDLSGFESAEGMSNPGMSVSGVGGVGGGLANPQEMESGANLVDDRQKQVDYYQVLGVSEDATVAEIKKKWLKLSLIYHPDKEGGDEKMYAKINEAYKVLSNPEARKKFNDSLAKTYDQLRDTENRDTEYHVNEDFLRFRKAGEGMEFDREKFLSKFDETRGQFKDLGEIDVVNEDEAIAMPKKTIEQIMAERDAELDGFRSAQKTDMFDPRKNMDEFNHVFTQFHKMTQRTDIQEVEGQFNDQLLAEQQQFSSGLGYAAFQPYMDYRQTQAAPPQDSKDQNEEGQENEDCGQKELSEADRREILETLIHSTQETPDQVINHRAVQEPAKMSDLEARLAAYRDQSEMLANKEKEEAFFENKLENDDKLTREEVDQLPEPPTSDSESESSSVEL